MRLVGPGSTDRAPGRVGLRGFAVGSALIVALAACGSAAVSPPSGRSPAAGTQPPASAAASARSEAPPSARPQLGDVLKAWAFEVSHGRLAEAAERFTPTAEVTLDGVLHQPKDVDELVALLRDLPCGFDVRSTSVSGSEVRAYATGNAYVDRPNCTGPHPYALVARFEDGRIAALSITQGSEG